MPRNARQVLNKTVSSGGIRWTDVRSYGTFSFELGSACSSSVTELSSTPDERTLQSDLNWLFTDQNEHFLRWITGEDKTILMWLVDNEQRPTCACLNFFPSTKTKQLRNRSECCGGHDLAVAFIMIESLLPVVDPVESAPPVSCAQAIVIDWFSSFCIKGITQGDPYVLQWKCQIIIINNEN